MNKFKEIETIPPAKQLVDIVLSKTNRKTPTVVHPGFKITRVRGFYMRKVKFCQTTYSEKLAKILEQFPKIDDIHPFYGDLCNVLYDRDHFKLALGQLATAKRIIDSIAKDHVRMMKFADSLYKAKMLKRAALGRMVTCVKKLSATLAYLEEVRQHLARLPTINPATRTLILTGYPNVGKSSFMNIVTNANVDVQPYAFTTKSLFVGHLDHNYVRWQVIDTPGILDHPLEERNTIEMTAITALAHLPAAILFFVDISEMCGYPIPQQVALFHQLKPLFANKPLLIVLNKTDLRKVSDLDPAEQELIRSMAQSAESDKRPIEYFPTSCATKDGVDDVRVKACDLLLSQRVEKKLSSGKMEAVKNRLFVTSVQPRADRPPCIPESVLRQRQGEDAPMEEEKTLENMLEREREEVLGGAGVYSIDTWKKAILEDDSWKYDVLPEVMDGRNVYDFIDPDIDKKLAELEREEELLLAEEKLRDDDDVLKDWRKTQRLLGHVHSEIKMRRLVRQLNKSKKPQLPRKAGLRAQAAASQLEHAVREPEKVKKVMERGRATSATKRRSSVLALGKRKRAASMETDDGLREPSVKRARSASVLSLKGLKDEGQAVTNEKRRRKNMFKRDQYGRKGEADRHQPDWKPKHLFSGKRGIGKKDRR